MTTMASQITSPKAVYSIFYSGADQRKHQSSASLAFVLGNSPGPVNSAHKGPVTRKMFPFDDVIMMFGQNEMDAMSDRVFARFEFKISEGCPDSKISWGQHGAHLGSVGPSWAPCWPHGPCYHGIFYWNSPLMCRLLLVWQVASEMD